MPRPALPKVNLDCKVCGQGFTVAGSKVKAYDARKGAVRLTCSKVCAVAYRTIKAAAQDPKYLDCQACGERKERSRQKLSGGRVGSYMKSQKFCSKACSDKGLEKQRLSHCEECSAPMPSLNYLSKVKSWRLCSIGCATMAAGRILGQDYSTFPDKHGYRCISFDGYAVPEHRAVVAAQEGRPLDAHETVHHRDGNRQNNDPDNLELWSSRHGKGQRVEEKVAAAIQLLKLYPQVVYALGMELSDASQVLTEGNSIQSDLISGLMSIN